MEGQGLATIALWNSVCRTSGALLQQVKLGGAHIVAGSPKMEGARAQEQGSPREGKEMEPSS